MKFASTNNSYTLIGRNAEVHNQLPTGVYRVEFSQMSGYSLTKLTDKIQIGEKVYGNRIEKVNKVMNAFQHVKRNFGVLLSGLKGSGKSLFAKQLANECLQLGMPVIMITKPSLDLSNFLQDLVDQPMMILFDEFEKIFNDAEDQSSLLSLFDGALINTKTLFVITCNNLDNLNDCLVNRPGRFHYHFRFDNPNSVEITEYMKNNIPVSKYDQIPKIVDFSESIPLNYDCLRSIAFEIAHGESFKSALEDLNIIKEFGDVLYEMQVVFNNDFILRATSLVDLEEDSYANFIFVTPGEDYNSSVKITFKIADVIGNTGIMPRRLEPTQVTIRWSDQLPNEYKDLLKSGVNHIIIKRANFNNLHFTL